jgi:hypothetical protein
LWTPVLVVTAALTGFLFVRRQRRVPSPLISPEVVADAVLARAVIVNGLAGAALYGTFTYVALVAALRTNAAGTGVLLVAMTAGQLVLSSSFAALARKHPDMTAWGRSGCLLGAAGLAAVAVAAALGGTPWFLAPGLFAIGAAFAVCTSAYTVLGQTRAKRALLGVTLGSLTFARQAGGLAGAAVFGWLALATTGALAASGLAVVFAAAAATMLVAWLTAPVVTSPDPASSRP